MEYIIVKRDMANLEMSSKEVIQVISELGQANLIAQEENHLDFIIWERRLTHLKRFGQVVKYKATTTERSHICVPKQYYWHVTIKADWEDLWWTNSPRDIFICYAHYFQFNLDETSFLCFEVELKNIGGNYKPCHEKNCSESMFSITVLWVGSAEGVNGPVIFIAKGENWHLILRGNNLVTKYGSPDVSCLIPNKAAYMDDATREKVVKVAALGIRKMAVSKVDLVCYIYS